METNVEIKIKNHKDFLSLENDKHGTVQISLEDRKVWGMYVPKKLNSIIEWEKKTKQNKTKKAYECCACWFTFKNKEYLNRHTTNEHEPSGAIWMLRMLINFQNWRIFEETHDKWAWT